jgi:outer membrane protein assembly factor BamB
MAVEYGTPDGKIHVVDAEDGSVAYETPYLGNHPHSSVTIDPERDYMFVGANNGLFFCFDFVNEELVWEYEMDPDPGDDELRPGDIKSTAAVHDDTVYITSWDHKMHAIDIDSGERIYAFETEGRTMSSPSYYDGRVYVGSHDRKLYAIDDDTGEEIWSFTTGAAVMSSPTIVPEAGVVVIGSNDSHVYMLDMATGAEVWRHEVDGKLSSVPTVTGGSIYLYEMSGTTWRFDVTGG